MKKFVCLGMMVALLVGCEKKEETNVTNPTEKKESTTTVVNPSPAKSP
jgi:hypothetical protein